MHTSCVWIASWTGTGSKTARTTLVSSGGNPIRIQVRWLRYREWKDRGIAMYLIVNLMIYTFTEYVHAVIWLQLESSVLSYTCLHQLEGEVMGHEDRLRSSLRQHINVIRWAQTSVYNEVRRRRTNNERRLAFVVACFTCYASDQRHANDTNLDLTAVPSFLNNCLSCNQHASHNHYSARLFSASLPLTNVHYPCFLLLQLQILMAEIAERCIYFKQRLVFQLLFLTQNHRSDLLGRQL